MQTSDSATIGSWLEVMALGPKDGRSMSSQESHHRTRSLINLQSYGVTYYHSTLETKLIFGPAP
jgi:hypothetical protein